MNVRKELQELITKVAGGTQAKIERTPRPDFGDYATNVALGLAKVENQNLFSFMSFRHIN